MHAMGMADWHGSRRARTVILLALVALSETANCMAQDAADADAGHQLARQWCAGCHIVDADQKRGSATGVPPFKAVASMPSTTFLSLNMFLQTPHDRMPDFKLSREQIADVSAFIISLKKK
jgi:mono/diheme cytochrome c family protein